jgi:hypothetical protein
MKKFRILFFAGLLLLTMLPTAFAKSVVWPPNPGCYQRVNNKGAENGILQVFNRPEGVFVSIFGLNYEGDESGLIPAMERGGADKLQGAGLLQMGQTGAEFSLQFMIATTPTKDGDEKRQWSFPAKAFYRMDIEGDAIVVKSLNKTNLNKKVNLDGRYALIRTSPVVNEALAAYAVTYFANNGPPKWNFAKVKRWEFDKQPAGMHKGIGRLWPVMKVDVYFASGRPDCSYLVTNDLESVFLIYPGSPVSLVDKYGAAG